MTDLNLTRWLRIASALALAALAMIVWSLLDPTPIPVIVSMSVGQAVGSLSFGIYLFVVFVDLRRAARRRRTSMEIPVQKPPEGEPE